MDDEEHLLVELQTIFKRAGDKTLTDLNLLTEKI